MVDAGGRAQDRRRFLERQLCEELPHAQTHQSFLEANAQAHEDPLFALGDLVDNAREARSTQCSIDVQLDDRRRLTMLEIDDDGCGMTEYGMRNALSIAYTKKGTDSGAHYGMGCTTAIPRLCDSALCFSVTESTFTVGLLSPSLSSKLGATELKVPQCTWARAHAAAQIWDARHGVPGAALSPEQRAASLEAILQHSPFKSEAALVEIFHDMHEHSVSSTGTRWVLWDLKRDELEPSSSATYDVLVRGKKALWPHQRSLRHFLEVLYYHDDALEKQGGQMTIELRKLPVKPRNWSTYLHDRHQGRYKPTKGSRTGLEVANFAFGYSRSLPDAVALFSDMTAGKRKEGSDYQQFSDYHGVFYYHQGTGATLAPRLTIPLAKLKLQTVGTNVMQTTEVRLIGLGMALVGVVKENFLMQAHNKTRYVEGTSGAEAPSLALLQSKMDREARVFLHNRVYDALWRLTKREPKLIPKFTSQRYKAARANGREDEDEGEGDDEENEVEVEVEVVTAERGGGAQSAEADGGTVEEPSSHRSGSKQPAVSSVRAAKPSDPKPSKPSAAKPSARKPSPASSAPTSSAPASSAPAAVSTSAPSPIDEGAEAELAAAMVEGDRYESIADPAVAGCMVWMEGHKRGRAYQPIRLRLCGGTLSKRAYRPTELRRVHFNPNQVTCIAAPHSWPPSTTFSPSPSPPTLTYHVSRLTPHALASRLTPHASHHTPHTSHLTPHS